MPVKCFDDINIDKLAERFQKRLKEGMTDHQQKMEGFKLLHEYHTELQKSLNGLKESVGMKPVPVVKLNVDKEAKKISNQYDLKIQEAQKEITPEEKPLPEPPKAEEGGKSAGLAQSVQEKRRGILGITDYEKGEGWNKEDALSKGKEMDEAGVKVSDIFDNFSKDERLSPNEMARLQWESVKLAKETQNAADNFGENSAEYKTALNNENAFLDKVQPLKTASSKIFTAQQGEVDIDTGSFTSVKKAVQKVNGEAPVSKEQENKIKELTEQNKKLKEDADELERKNIELTEKAFNGGVGKNPKTKKSHEDYLKERKDAFQEARDALKNLRTGQSGVGVSIPLVRELSAIAPSIAKIVKSLIEEGTDKLGDIVDIIHEELSKDINGLKRKDVYDFVSEIHLKAKNDLKEKRFEEKNKSGLVKSKAEKPLTEGEQIEADNIELDGLQKQVAGKKDQKFSIDESKAIWDYAKKNYLDKGVSYRDMIKQVSQDLGLSWKQTLIGVTSPKTKPISDAMWKKQGELMRSQNATKIWVDAQSKSVYVKAFLKASAAVRGMQVFGHAGVFMGTHAGMTMFQPRTWKYTIPAFFRAYKYAYGNKAAYEQSLEELRNRPLYTSFQRAGLRNNPDQVNVEEFQKSQTALGGAIKEIGEQGIKGFNALKVLRQDLAEYHYNKLTEAEKNDEGSIENIAKIVNNATGASNYKIPELLNETFFAFGMESARWGKLTRNPMRATAIAVKAIMHPEKTTIGERVFAKVWASRVGEQIATYASLLAVNAAIQSIVNPNNPTNILHPNDKDWLRFKFGDITVDPTSGMASTIDFIKKLATIPFENNKELMGDTKTQAFGKAAIGRARGKLAPFYSTIWDMVTQTDYNGNQLPLSNLKPDKNHRNIGWLEFATERLPIPVAEAFHEMYQSAADNGVKPTEFTNILQALMLAGISGTTGARASESLKDKKSKSGLAPQTKQ